MGSREYIPIKYNQLYNQQYYAEELASYFALSIGTLF